MAHAELAAGQVEVLPAEAEELTLAEAGAERGHEQRLQPIVAEALEQAPELITAERRISCRGGGGASISAQTLRWTLPIFSARPSARAIWQVRRLYPRFAR